MVKGLVYDVDNPFVRINYFVVNKRTGKGMFGNHKGQFQIDVLKRDSLHISARDYYPVKLVVRDSLRSGNLVTVKIGLRRKEYELLAVDIKPIRDHTEITKDIKDLVDPKSIELVTADALNSPITALYQAFSKLEREKHKMHVLEAEDRKKEVLKELLDKYNSAGIIELDQDMYDDFLGTSNFNIDYLKTLSDYNLIKYIEYRYNSYNQFNEFYMVFKRLERNEYERMLLEAKNEKMVLVLNVFKKYIDKEVWDIYNSNEEFIFEFINYANFNIAELIQMNDYGVIMTVGRKYERFKEQYGYGKR